MCTSYTEEWREAEEEEARQREGRRVGGGRREGGRREERERGGGREEGRIDSLAVVYIHGWWLPTLHCITYIHL